MKLAPKESGPSGFTLVELLVVIAIIGVLVGLLLPAVQAAREAARRTECLNHVKQLVLASHSYVDSNGHFPSSSNESGASYCVQLLPYMEQQELYDRFIYRDNINIGFAVNREFWGREMPQFRCPSQNNDSETYSSALDESLATTELPWRAHYLAVLGAKDECVAPASATSVYRMAHCPGSTGGMAISGIMFGGSKIPFRRITDGTSNTFLVGEVSWDQGGMRVWAIGSISTPQSVSYSWATYGGRNLMWPLNTATSRRGIGPANDVSFGSIHPGGAIFGLADGSTRFISENIELTVLKAAASRNIGEVELLDE